jgi:hypothetical protein
MCRMDGLEFAHVFKLAYELFSALCFALGAKVTLGSGIINEVEMDIPIASLTLSNTEHRQIPVLERHSTIYKIALIRNDVQATLLRLFRHGYSVNDPFSKLLFYWHTLVYPAAQEDDAVNYINNNIAALDPHVQVHLDAIRREPCFSSSGVAADIGSYIRRGIRHSIAHIVRSGTDYNSMDMDDLEEIRHVHSAAHVLENLCRKRIQEDFDVQIGDDPNILRFTSILAGASGN